MRCREPVKLGCAVICGFCLFLLIAGDSDGKPSLLLRGGRIIRTFAQEAPVPEDFVRFTNGDVLSGDVEEIVDGAVAIKPNMAEGKLTIPVGGVKEVVFKDGDEQSSFSTDRLVLVNGESLSGKIEAMADGKVALTMPSSGKVKVDVEKAAAMAFYRGEEVLAEESFDSGLPEEMQFVGGRWRTQKGWLLQSDSRAVECYASVPVTQTGEILYEWIVNTKVGNSTGIYFMASDPGLWQERAYFIRIRREYVYIYMCRNGQEDYCGSRRISLYKNRNEVRLKYDSGRGRIELWIDRMEVGRWECLAPIRMGKYIVLRADGTAALDDLNIVRKGGAVRAEAAPVHAGGDVLMLVNGDEISGKVKGLSERSVSFTAYNSEQVNEIDREKLLTVRFERKMQKLPRAVSGTVVIVMRNGDRISGELLFLKQEVARMSSEQAGVVDLRREDLRKVIFREFP